MIYGCGLRISECINLKVEDIDSNNMRVWVRNAKGNKDRITLLSPTMLAQLRAYYIVYKPKSGCLRAQMESSIVPLAYDRYLTDLKRRLGYICPQQCTP